MRSGISRTVASVGLAASAVWLGGCSDARISNLTAGISRDSALKVINDGAAGDSLARVYKQEAYLINGKRLNVLFYDKDGIKQETDSTLKAKALTPIVTVDGKVTGWGWAHYDSVVSANNIKGTPRD
jgi:hypothetical protein